MVNTNIHHFLTFFYSQVRYCLAYTFVTCPVFPLANLRGIPSYLTLPTKFRKEFKIFVSTEWTMRHLLGTDWRRPQFHNPLPFSFYGHLPEICPSPPNIKQRTHAQLLAKQSWHLFDLNLLPSFRKLCLLVLLYNWISFTWPWRLFSSFCILLSNSASASSPSALLLFGSLNNFSSHSSAPELLTEI